MDKEIRMRVFMAVEKKKKLSPLKRKHSTRLMRDAAGPGSRGPWGGLWLPPTVIWAEDAHGINCISSVLSASPGQILL